MRFACVVLFFIPLVGCAQSRDLVATRQVSIQTDPATTSRKDREAHHGCGADRPNARQATGSAKHKRCSSQILATSKGDAKLSKPSPEIFDAALAQAGSDPRFTFVVGDTPYDILAAHRRALPIVAVLSGGFERELLTKAEFIFDDVRAVVEKIDEINAWFE